MQSTDGRDSQLKKPLLYALIASVVFGALLGIFIVLRDSWGWLEVRVILTTVVIAVASICGLACDLSRTPNGKNLLPITGLTLVGSSALMLLAGIWFELDSEAIWKTIGVAVTFALASVHVSLLSIAKLSKRFRWVYLISCQIIYGLAILISAIIVFEIDSEALWRFLAVHSIVVAAISLIVPILHRIGKTEQSDENLLMPLHQRNLDSIDQEIEKLEKKLSQLRLLRARITAS